MNRFRLLLISAALPAALAACGDSPRPYGARTTPPPTPANTAAPPTAAPAAESSTPSSSNAASGNASSAAPIPPNAAEDVDAKKGSETGMVGGASGTVASGGKPGSGTQSGGGTGPAVSSGEREKTSK